MSASLVGSEMCIRDRRCKHFAAGLGWALRLGVSSVSADSRPLGGPLGPLARLRPQPPPAGHWLPTTFWPR
eukprot:3281457-Alexandrium_andersonii.AAC.1